MLKTTLSCFLAVLLVCSVTLGQVERLYVSTSDGHLLAIDGLQPGTNDRGSAGDNTIADVSQPGVSHTVLGVGNASSPQGLQVVVGATDAVVRVFNADLSVNTFNKPISAPGNAVTSIQVGSYNGLNHSILASHGFIDGAGNRGSNMVVMNDTTTTLSVNTIGNILIKDAKLADIDPTRAGNELVMGGINDLTQNPGTALMFEFEWNGAASAFVTQTGPLNNNLEAIAVGDLFAGPNLDDIVQIGANVGGGNPVVPSASSQAFTGGFAFQWFNAIPVSLGTLVDGEIGELTSNPGNEYVGAGNSEIFIVDGQTGAGTLQQISTGENNTSLILADILGNDGIMEIVVGTASGKVMAYEHAIAGDLSSPFTLAATLNLDPALVGAYSITDIQSVTIPEPATMILLTLGTLGVLRRRKH